MENLQKHVHVLQHHDCENLGTIAQALQNAGVSARYTRSFEAQPVPKQMGDAAGLIIMGGPQSVYEQDKFPYLRNELRLIEDALQYAKPILGVCLGSQLLASALGASVYPARQKEIGWNRVTLTDFAATDQLFGSVQKTFTPLHWHGDIFDLPRGATPLASSALTARQAFRHGKNAYALLFHIEVTLPQVHRMVETFTEELQSAGLNGSAINLNTHLATLRGIGSTVFTRWVTLL
jgi:GMP synthase (glutamine-hydrolysing)